MVSKILLLNYGDNILSIEEEEKLIFLKSILLSIGIPLSFWGEELISIEQKAELRDTLLKYSVNLLDKEDKSLQVTLQGNLVATFHKPNIVLKKDFSKSPPDFYLEMKIETTSIFDQEKK